MGYMPSKADPDLWFKEVGDHYEYVARFVDDVISFSKDPMAVMKDLEKHYSMKGVGKPQHYLGGDVVELGEEWNKEGIYTAFSAETYVKNSLGKLATMCGKPNFPDKKTPFPNLTNRPAMASRIRWYGIDEDGDLGFHLFWSKHVSGNVLGSVRIKFDPLLARSIHNFLSNRWIRNVNSDLSVWIFLKAPKDSLKFFHVTSMRCHGILRQR